MAAFTIQHINDYDVPSTGGSQTITAVTVANTVVLNTNNFYISAGTSGSSTTAVVDDISVGVDLTSTTNVNFDRASSTVSTRAQAAVWEYTGQAGGPNEFIVRSRGTITIDLDVDARTKTATCTTTPTDIDKCVVFITGVINNEGGAVYYDDGTVIAWLSGTNTINFERGGNGTQATTFYYTVVEFTGSNWTIHHGYSGDVTADTGSITLYDSQKGTGTTSTVAAWNKAFIIGQFKADDNTSNYALADLYPVYDPGTGTGTVDWTFDGGHDASDNQHLVYVIENSDTNFSVARYNTGAISLPANDNTQTITAVTSLTEAMVIGFVETSGTGTAFARGVRNFGFNSTTQAFSWCHRSGNTGQIEYQVIDFNGMSEGSLTLNNDFIASSNTVYEPTVSPGPVTLTNDFIASSYEMYEPTVNPGAITLSSDFIASTNQLYEPTLFPGAAALTTDFISSSYQVFETTLTPGAVTLTSDFISTSYQIFEPTLASVAALNVDFIASSNQTFEPTLSPGAVTLTGDYIVSSYQIFEPTLAPGAVTLTSDFISSNYQTFEPTLVPGAVTLTSDYIATSYQIFEPDVNLVLAGQVLCDFIPSSNQLYEPTLTPGPVALTSDFISTSYQIFEPTLLSTFELSPDFIASSYQVFEPTATTPQPQTLDSDFIASSYQIFEPNVTTPSLEVEQGATDDDKKYRADNAIKAVEMAYSEYIKIKRQRAIKALKMLNNLRH